MLYGSSVYFQGGSGGWRRGIHHAPSNNHLYMGSGDVPTIWLNSPSGYVRDYNASAHMGRFLTERDFTYKDAGTGTDITVPNEATEFMIIYTATNSDAAGMAFAARGVSRHIAGTPLRWGNFIRYDGDRRFYLITNPGVVFRVLWR